MRHSGSRRYEERKQYEHGRMVKVDQAVDTDVETGAREIMKRCLGNRIRYTVDATYNILLTDYYCYANEDEYGRTITMGFHDEVEVEKGAEVTFSEKTHRYRFELFEVTMRPKCHLF